MVKLKFFYSMIGISCLTLIGCSSQEMKYSGANSMQALPSHIGSTDLQITAEEMLDALLTFPPVVQVTSHRRPLMFIDSIKNETEEFIDTASILNVMTKKIFDSEKFRFVETTNLEEVPQDGESQGDAGVVKQNQVKPMASQAEAEYTLYSNISSIVKRKGLSTEAYYKLTMKVIHLKTDILEWQDEKEIRAISQVSKSGR